MIENNRVAVLIDAENVPATLADGIIEKASEMGDIVMKEMYGSGSALCNWTEPALRYVIRANITLRQTKGKNTSDIALTIGAMDLLIADVVDTIVIVSSDSDFSALAIRLRMAGKNVVGMGQTKSNAMWKVACSSFITLDSKQNIAQAAETVNTEEPDTVRKENKPNIKVEREVTYTAEEVEEKALEIIQEESDENGWITINKLVKEIQTRFPQMLPKRFSFTKSVALFETMASMEMRKEARQGRRGGATVSLRIRTVDLDTVIREKIQQMLDEKNGRLPVAALFPELITIPGFKELQKQSGRKPQRFLIEKYGDMFGTEDVNGGLWTVPLKGSDETVSNVERLPDSDQIVTNDDIEISLQQEDNSFTEEAVNADPVEEEPFEKAIQQEVPKTLSERMRDMLVEQGWPAETAGDIAEIMTQNTALKAYNAMRKKYGNSEGGRLYNETKGLLKQLKTE